MDTKLRIVDRVYQDFEPQMEWVNEEDCDTLILLLPGFRKEQLRVQVTSNHTLRISGERPLADQKYRRFEKEILVPSNVETTEITAEFEKDKLYVRQPKVISQHKPKSEVPQDRKDAQEQVAPEVASKASNVDKRSYEKTTVQENVLDHANKDPHKAPKKEESSSRDGKSCMQVADATGKLLGGPEGNKLVVGGLTWDLKKAKALMNLFVVALLVLAVVLSIIIAMKLSGQSKSTHSAV
ncbi:inactive protein RESTRICTED TEV MOVEMENT 2-like [Carya illinoinensis]|uniref:SHSP domain-containing protein n=1 Tax=Carya illinoinensis TaxID=32201 RepID=A0A8T1NTE8_CARIL|nr:inactive protein RESTRICTED TEV MOVEMENT 2-like [Carya illinoinensis]KAG6632010.1 hypothetical protein CIPAW_13G128700 [Carya illinoinensis]